MAQKASKPKLIYFYLHCLTKAIAITLLFTGCVSQQAYNDLKSERAALEKQLFEKELQIQQNQQFVNQLRDEKDKIAYQQWKTGHEIEAFNAKLTEKQQQIDSLEQTLTSLDSEYKALSSHTYPGSSYNSTSEYGTHTTKGGISPATTSTPRGIDLTARTPINLDPNVPISYDSGDDHWDAPKSSYSHLVDQDNFLDKYVGKCKTIKDLNQQITLGLESLGYQGRLSYFAVQGGFAIATDVEQITYQGHAQHGDARWKAALASPRIFSLDFFKNLLFARKGYFRVFVLLISDNMAELSSYTKNRGISNLTLDQVRQWDWMGVSAADFAAWPIAERPFTYNYNCKVLVYEFEVIENRMPKLSKAIGLDQHLTNSGLLKGLFDPRP